MVKECLIDKNRIALTSSQVRAITEDDTGLKELRSPAAGTSAATIESVNFLILIKS